MKFLKMIVEFLRTKFGAFAAKNTSATDKLNAAARRIIDNIDMLRHRDVSAANEISKIRAKGEASAAEYQKREKEILLLRRQGKPVQEVMVKIALQHRQISEAMTQRADALVEMTKQIKATVVEMDDKLQEIKMQLEFARLNEESKAMGIGSVEDVIESAGHANVDVDTILTEIDVFIGDEARGVASSTDITLYMAELDEKVRALA